MKRRAFIAGLGGAAAWPVVARAQRSTIPVIGYLEMSPGATNLSAAFRQGLRETGFVEGRTVVIEFRSAENDSRRLPELVADLARRRVAVIAAGARTALAAKAAALDIPVVFFNGGDPVRAGLVAGIDRPGGNLTGVSLLGPDLASKRLGLLHDMVPKASMIGILDDSEADTYQDDQVRAAAHSIGLATTVARTAGEADWNDVFSKLIREGADTLFVTSSTPLYRDRARLVPFVERYRIPAIYPAREFAEIGGLMAYGPNIPDLYRQMGIYVGRVLKGDKPADLPILLPTRFEFLLNLKTAKALGLGVPPGILAIADEVVE
jgi:putative ABC transport system substrate-binding protein